MVFRTPINITNITTGLAPDGMSELVNWQTDVPTTSQVSYGLTAALGSQTALLDTAAMVTNHAVVISGLQEDTDYYYQISAAAPLYTSVVFNAQLPLHTLPNPTPQLENGGFENAHNGVSPSPFPWVQYTTKISGVPPKPIDGIVGPYPSGGAQAWSQGFQAFDGSYFLGAAATRDFKYGGVFQRVQVTSAGQPCIVGAEYATYANISPPDSQVAIGIDPNGGVDPTSPNIVWRSGCSPSNNSQYHSTGIGAAAGSTGIVTVFLEIRQIYQELHVCAIDDVTMGPPSPATIGQAKSSATGAVSLSNETVTFVDPDTISYNNATCTRAYIEEDDRSAGHSGALRPGPGQYPVCWKQSERHRPACARQQRSHHTGLLLDAGLRFLSGSGPTRDGPEIPRRRRAQPARALRLQGGV